jgi:Phosphotransferase enzyme family
MDRARADEWIRASVTPAGPIQVVHERPWSTVLRVPLHDGAAWFKAGGSLQDFEAGLTARLFARWPDRVPEVLACSEDRSWLLLRDAGIRLADLGNPPESWLGILPRYGELQRGEAQYADEHLRHHVPDLRVAGLVRGYDQLLREVLPLEEAEVEQLRGFARRFEHLCAELEASGIPETVQHDDLHMNNVFLRGGMIRILDWGDSCISHPFASLVATFRFLEERNGLRCEDRWFRRLRDAYLEPWGVGLVETFALASRVGTFAYAITALRQRRVVPAPARARFDADFSVRLRRALGTIT